MTSSRNLCRFVDESDQAFSIRDAVRHELSWTHYRILLRVEGEQARRWYMDEAAAQNWSSQALKRYIVNRIYYLACLIMNSKIDKTTNKSDGYQSCHYLYG